MADKELQAYAYSILAKDASGRYSNPRRALRSYEDIMEVAGGSDIKSSMKDTFASAIKEAVGEITQPVARKEEPKQTQHFVTKKDLHYLKQDLIKTVKSLIPTPPEE